MKKISPIILVLVIIALIFFPHNLFAQSDFEEIFIEIKNNTKFERFPEKVLEQIEKGEIDQYKVSVGVYKAPQDEGHYGAKTNVEKLRNMLEQIHGLKIRGVTSGSIQLMVPVQDLPIIASYDIVDRIIGQNFGLKTMNDHGNNGIIKFYHDNKIFDIPYVIENGKIISFYFLGIGIWTQEGGGSIEFELPRELTNTIDPSGDYFLQHPDKDRYEILELNDDIIKIHWDFEHELPSNYLSFWGTISTADEITPDPTEVPRWILHDAGWWGEGIIDDEDFFSALDALIELDYVSIPHDSKSQKTAYVPDWMRNTSKWWSEGKITDNEFFSTLEFLMEKQIIRMT